MTTLTAFLFGVFVMAGLIWVLNRRLGFQAQQPEDYAEGPTFNLSEHLQGDIICEGMIYGPTGRVSSRFTADFHASWQGNSGRMAEHFHYDSGTVQDREWHLTVDADGNVTAEADDLVGTGTGKQFGSGVKLSYRIRLPESAGGHVLDVVDWMYMLENGTIMNRSQFRKFGVQVAELVATMRPAQATNERQAAA